MTVLPDSRHGTGQFGVPGAGRGRPRERGGLALAERRRVVGGGHPPGRAPWRATASAVMRSPAQSKSARQCSRAPARTASPSSLWQAADGTPSVQTRAAAVSWSSPAAARSTAGFSQTKMVRAAGTTGRWRAGGG